MLKELSKNDWLSLLAIPQDMVPTTVMLRGTRNLGMYYETYKPLFKNVLEINTPNAVLDHVFIGEYRGHVTAYASVYGDAMASEVTHVFGVLGASFVIQTGCCGALQRGILPGDLVAATAAYCGEGASQYYTPRKVVEASPHLVTEIRDTCPVSLHKGPIWTTSALLAEGEEEIRRWGHQGYIAVDMETATAFAVAEYFSMDRLSLLFVFDNPCEGDHLLLEDAEKQKRRLTGEKAMMDVAFSLIETYEEEE